MRDYGAVSPQFWIGKTGKALRGNPAAQLVALYLMTSPHANMIGVFYVTVGSIAEETGLTLEGASKALRSLIEARFCQFDADTSEVFVHRMAAFQIGEQLEPKDNRCKGVARELEKVMSDRLKSAFRAIYSVAFHLPDPAPKQPPAPPPTQAPLEPLRSQDQEQDQDQDQNSPSSIDEGSGTAPRAAPPPPPAFDGKNAETLNGKAIVPIAAGWELPEQWGIDAEALGWKPSQVLHQAEKFRQYWTAGRGSGTRRSVKGWRQSWSTWLERAAKDQR